VNYYTNLIQLFYNPATWIQLGDKPTATMEDEKHQYQHNQGQQPEEVRSASSDQEAQERRERYIESVMEYIKHLNEGGSPSFEEALDNAGLVSGLELAGGLPILDDSEDMDRFLRRAEQRDEILKTIEIGAALQRYFPHLAPLLVDEEQVLGEGVPIDPVEQRKAELFRILGGGWRTTIIGEWFFEEAIERRGLRQRLDAIGVWPVLVSPDPFDIDEEPEQSEQWGKEHPEEADKFSRDLHRDIKLRTELYIGALIARNFPGLFTNQEPDSIKPGNATHIAE